MKLSKSILKSSQKKLSITTIGNRAAKTMRVTPSSSQVRQMLLWHFSFGEPGRGHPSAGVLAQARRTGQATTYSPSAEYT